VYACLNFVQPPIRHRSDAFLPPRAFSRRAGAATEKRFLTVMPENGPHLIGDLTTKTATARRFQARGGSLGDQSRGKRGKLAPLRRSSRGAYTPITDWRHNGDR